MSIFQNWLKGKTEVPTNEVDLLCQNFEGANVESDKVKGLVDKLKTALPTEKAEKDDAAAVKLQREKDRKTVQLAKAILDRKKQMDAAITAAKAAKAKDLAVSLASEKELDILIALYDDVTAEVDLEAEYQEIQDYCFEGVEYDFSLDKASAATSNTAQFTQVTNTTGLPPAAPGSVSTVPNI